IARRPENPVPNATSTRPGAIAVSIAVAAAFTMGCRSEGTRTPGPMPMRDVRSAASARHIHTSGLFCGVSYSQARAYPSSSASAMFSCESRAVGKATETSMLFPPLLTSELGSAAVRHVDPAGEQAGLPRGAARGAVEVRGAAEEQRATIGTAEHAGEHAGADGQFLQDLAALPHAERPS